MARGKSLDQIEESIKRFYRSLDPYNYSLYHKLDEYSNSIRKQTKGFNKEERFKAYGLIAEETALYLLRMNQTQMKSEIIDSLIFEYKEGETTEIDIIYITKNTLYIIECKHRSSDITVNEDGSFITGDREESPINQNIGHIRKLLNTSSYGSLIPPHRIMSIIYLELNNSKVKNPTTIFKKEVNGAFASSKNLIPLIHKIERENAGGRIPIKALSKELRKLGEPYQGKEGMKKHLKFLKSKYGK